MNDESLLQLRLIRKLSLWFSFVAFAGMVFVAILIPNSDTSYYQQVQSLTLSQKNLPLLMLIGGLVLAVGTGITTWVIAIYSSFRVAGPLFRISNNLEQGIESSLVANIPLRKDDFLQEDAKLLQETSTHLHQHYSRMQVQIDKAMLAVAKNDIQSLSAAINNLKSQ